MVKIVTKTGWPKIWEAMDNVDYDSGGEGNKDDYEFEIPDEWELGLLEERLTALTDDEMEIITMGEQEEREELIVRKKLIYVDEFINAYFNMWGE